MMPLNLVLHLEFLDIAILGRADSNSAKYVDNQVILFNCRMTPVIGKITLLAITDLLLSRSHARSLYTAHTEYTSLIYQTVLRLLDRSGA
jgi:hypothetical protein